jgi:hypothetical protein
MTEFTPRYDEQDDPTDGEQTTKYDTEDTDHE